MPGHDLPERHPGPRQLRARGAHPRHRIAHAPGPLERRRRRQPPALFGAQHPRRHLEPERHRLDDPVALELEIDVRELLVHPHAHRHAPGEQRRQAPATPPPAAGASCTSRVVIPNSSRAPNRSEVGLITVLISSPSSVTTAISTGRGRHRSPTVPHGEHRQVRLAENVSLRGAAREIAPHPLIRLQIPRQHLALQHQTLEARAARQRHIQLPVGESTAVRSTTTRSRVWPWDLWIVIAQASFIGSWVKVPTIWCTSEPPSTLGRGDLPGVLAHVLGAAVPQQHRDQRAVFVGLEGGDAAQGAVDTTGPRGRC